MLRIAHAGHLASEANLNDQVYETLKHGSCAGSSARARR